MVMILSMPVTFEPFEIILPKLVRKLSTIPEFSRNIKFLMDVRHLGFLEILVTFEPFEIVIIISPSWIYYMIKKLTFRLNLQTLHTNLVGLSQTVQQL